ncbi:MAG: arginine--tRNA ligase [Candidatus Dojkabacteria bacterium]|jgi:arginyl-tRNA synthetase
MIQEKITKLVLDSLEKLSIEVSKEDIIVEEPKDESKGDYSTNIAMRMASKVGKNPVDLAEEIVKGMEKDDDFEKVEFVPPGFINFYLSKTYLLKEMEKYATQGAEYFKSDVNKGKKTIVEYTDANPFKTFHIGHLYTNAVGEAISRLQESLSTQVERITYQGDVGLHVAKTLWGFEEKLKEEKKDFETIEKLGLVEKVRYIGDAYVMGAEAYDYVQDKKAIQEIDDLNYYVFYITNPVLEKKDFSKFEEANIKEKYQKGRLWCLEYFETIYKRLGTKFAHYFFESEVGEAGLKLVLENVGKIFKEDDGAVIYEGDEEKGLHTRVFVNRYGLPTYEAKEIGLALKKEELLDYDESIIITAEEQTSYFKVVMDALGKLNPEIPKKTKHFPHGMIKLPGAKKMSSRKGGVIEGEWLLGETKKKVEELMKQNNTLPEELHDEVSEKISIGAVKYAFLKVGIGSDIVFDFDQATAFDGDTGPYIQYVYSRANSLLKEYDFENVEDFSVNTDLFNPFVLGLMRLTSKYQKALLDSAVNYSPSILTQYLFDLGQSFNSFYQNVRLSEVSEDDREILLLIVKAVMNVVEHGLYNLGISVVERM